MDTKLSAHASNVQHTNVPTDTTSTAVMNTNETGYTGNTVHSECYKGDNIHTVQSSFLRLHSYPRLQFELLLVDTFDSERCYTDAAEFAGLDPCIAYQ